MYRDRVEGLNFKSFPIIGNFTFIFKAKPKFFSSWLVKIRLSLCYFVADRINQPRILILLIDVKSSIFFITVEGNILALNIIDF